MSRVSGPVHKIFQMPTPGGTTEVAFEYPDGTRGMATRIEGGRWKTDRGRRLTWARLLEQHEPLRQVKREVKR